MAGQQWSAAGLKAIGAAIPADDEEAWSLLKKAQLIPRSGGRPGAKATPAAASSSTSKLRGASAGTGAGTVDPSLRFTQGDFGGGGPASSAAMAALLAAEAARQEVQRLAEERPQRSQTLPRPELYPPNERIAMLERQVSETLTSLWHETRESIHEVKGEAEAKNERSYLEARRSHADAELEFRRLSELTTGRGGLSTDQSVALELEVASLLRSVPTPTGPSTALKAAMKTSHVPEQVALLTDFCERQVLAASSEGPRDRVQESIGAVASALGSLLEELDRDVQALVIALVNASHNAASQSYSSRLTMGAAERPAHPSAAALARQLEIENELLTEVLSGHVRR